MTSILISLLVSNPSFCSSTNVIEGPISSVKIRSESYFLKDSSNSPQILNALNVDSSLWKRVSKNGFAKYDSKNYYWLKFKIKNLASGQYYIKINETSLNELKIWQVKANNDIELLGHIENIANSQKSSLENRYPTFRLKIDSQEETSIYLYAKEFGGTLILPISISTESDYMSDLYLSNLLLGLNYGVLFLLMLIGITTFYFFREKIHLFYVLHLFGLVIFLSNRNGIGLKYLWGDIPWIRTSAGYIAAIISITFLGLIVSKSIKLKEYSIHFHRYVNSFAIFFIISFTILGISKSLLVTNEIPILLKGSQIIFLFYPVSIIAICLYIYYKTRNIDSIVFLFVFGLTLITMILLAVIKYGLVPADIFQYLQWVPAFEGILILGLLFKDIHKSHLEKIAYQSRLVAVKEKSIRNFLDGKRNESRRLSRHLHDDINTKLTVLKMSLDPENSENGLQNKPQLSKISDSIKTITHDLLPSSLSRYGIIKAIENEVFEIESSNNDVAISFNSSGNYDNINSDVEMTLYYACMELVQNALKHSKASKIEIKMKETNKSILLIVSDNGVGYDFKKMQNGIGLKSINHQIELNGGKFKYDNREGSIHEISLNKVAPVYK